MGQEHLRHRKTVRSKPITSVYFGILERTETESSGEDSGIRPPVFKVDKIRKAGIALKDPAL